MRSVKIVFREECCDLQEQDGSLGCTSCHATEPSCHSCICALGHSGLLWRPSLWLGPWMSPCPLWPLECLASAGLCTIDSAPLIGSYKSRGKRLLWAAWPKQLLCESAISCNLARSFRAYALSSF
eukprot:864008-Amphidinium_carterae.2